MKSLQVVTFVLALFALPALAAQRFARTGGAEPVVGDSLTGLVWQGCPAGLTGDTCATGSASTMVWSSASSYCTGLTWANHDDWYLPDPKEMHSIVDNRRTGPAVDPIAFPNTPGTRFWTSSSYADNTTAAWNVNFANGGVNGYDKGSSYHVRCVRRGP